MTKNYPPPPRTISHNKIVINLFPKKYFHFAGDVASAKLTRDRKLVHKMLRTGKLSKNIPEMLKIFKVLGFPYKGKFSTKFLEGHLTKLTLTNFPPRRFYLKEIYKKRFQKLYCSNCKKHLEKQHIELVHKFNTVFNMRTCQQDGEESLRRETGTCAPKAATQT